jgi:hypothetical protein
MWIESSVFGEFINTTITGRKVACCEDPKPRLFQEGANGGQGSSFSFKVLITGMGAFLWSSSSYTPCGKIVVPVIKTETGAPEAICQGPPNL